MALDKLACLLISLIAFGNFFRDVDCVKGKDVHEQLAKIVHEILDNGDPLIRNLSPHDLQEAIDSAIGELMCDGTELDKIVGQAEGPTHTPVDPAKEQVFAAKCKAIAAKA